MYSTTSFRQLTPAPPLFPPQCWQARAFTGARDPNLEPTLWGWHCWGFTLFPKGAPNVRAQGDFFYCGRGAQFHPLGLSPFQNSTKLALVSCLENSWGWGGAERGTPRTEVIFRDRRGVALGWGSTEWAELSQ